MGTSAVHDDPSASAGLLEKVAAFYHRSLRSAQRARAWLKRHGFDADALGEEWQVGAADGRLLKSLPADGRGLAEELRAAGVLTPAGREFFLGGITLPVRDGDGGLVSLAGVSFRGEDRLLPGSPTALWNAPAVRLYPEIILATRLLDALSLHQAGFPQTCAVVGAHLRPADLALLREAGVRRILLAGAPAGGGSPLAEQLSGFPVRADSLRAHGFRLERGTPELISAVVRLLAAPAAGDGRSERMADGFAVSFGGRRYEALGIDRAGRRLKLTLKVERSGKLHIDTLDLYQARARRALLQDLGCFLEEPPAVIEADIAKLIQLAEEHGPAQTGGAGQPVPMSEDERREAESFGKAGNLVDLILEDFRECGLVGERSNILLCYLAAVSRKAEEPISVLILSSSGAGKSALQDATLRLCPPEDVVKLTSLTGRALFYKGAGSLKHKILALEEEAGVRQASYAIRNLISAGELVIETTVKDLGSGRLTTVQNRVEGPTAVFITTTNPDVDPETRSRFFVTGVDESREQTRAILESQRHRRTWQGRTDGGRREAIARRHWNFQRLLRPVVVVNPYAEQLSFTDDRLQSRRDQPKYLNLVSAAAFLGQMRKPLCRRDGREYVEVEEADLALADALAGELLGRGLDDLNTVSRDLLGQIERMVRGRIVRVDGAAPRVEDIEFTRREIREHTGWPHARVERYLRKLVDLEYLITHAGRNGKRYLYTLAACGQGYAGGQHGFSDLPTTFSAPSQGDEAGKEAQSKELARKPSHLSGKDEYEEARG